MARTLLAVALMVVGAAAGQAQPLQAVQTAAGQAQPAGCAQGASLASKARYIGVDELEPGMRGYGLTVFKGSKVERFAVEVVSVLRKHGPKRDAILIRCDDARFDLAVMVRGVSGSPVYFDGRLAGAMAFGWALSKEPLYGVTPIAQMLRVGASREGEPGSGGSVAGATGRGGSLLGMDVYRDLMRPTLLESADLAAVVGASPLSMRTGSVECPMGGLTRLPVAFCANGLSPLAMAYLKSRIPNLAFDPMLAGAAGTGQMAPGEEPAMVPGGTLTVPLLLGDMQAQVLGTITEVVGNKVYGFGHAWMGEGASNWPMGSGVVHTFVSRLDASFKLGSTVKVVGALRGDESVAVYGETGREVPMIPMEVTVDWFDRGQPDHFSMRLAEDEQTSPVLATQAALSPLLDRGGLPREHTIDYEMVMEFDGLETIRFDNMSSASGVGGIVTDMLDTLTLMLNNPWQKVRMKRLVVGFAVSSEDRVCGIRSVRVARPVYRGGEKVRVIAELQPMRGEAFEVEVGLALPGALPAGDYELILGGADVYREQLRRSQPHRYNVFSAEDVRNVLAERLALGRGSLYLSMVVPGSRGLAIEDEALPDLPASKAMLLTDGSRKGLVVGFQELLSSRVPTEYVVKGGTNLKISVRAD